MGELHSIQDVFDWLKDSTAFQFIGGAAVIVAILAFVRGGRR